jgi:hypothetical protein
MPKSYRPTIQIQLGVMAEANPSLRKLRKLARNRAEVVSADQPDLMFLVQSDFPEVSALTVVDGAYVIEGQLPRVKQGRLHDPAPVSVSERADEADAQDIAAVLEAVTMSAEILNEVARFMATSPSLIDDIRRLEQNRGVETSAMRAFVYKKQESFEVTVGDEVVPFQAPVVRAAVTVGEPVKVLLTPVRPKLEGYLMRGRVETTVGDRRNEGIQRGGTLELRFGRLEPWQAALVELAHQLGQPLLVTAIETVATCSLKALPVDVQVVHNWASLINLGFQELSRAANDMYVEPPDDLDDLAA